MTACHLWSPKKNLKYCPGLVDHYRVLNQSLGWEKANALLRAIVSRLQEVVPANVMVAYLHEEHFALLAASPAGANSALPNRMSKALAVPFLLEGTERRLDFSIGIVEESLHQVDSPDNLIEKAKLALYRVEPAAGTAIASLSSQHQSQLAAEFSLEHRLRLAVENRELEVHYQPIVRMTDLKIVGMEALARWQSDGTWISPGQFIPLAEEVGVIQDLSKWILRTACIEFQSAIGNDRECYLLVNVGANELYADTFVSRVECALAESGLSPRQLCLEVTEHSLTRDIPLAVEQMQRLVKLGVRFAIDDIRTGFASLRYLQLLPVDTMKIDRCFVEGLPQNKTDVAITRATIAMAKNLRLQIVCEGIETCAQMQFLQEEGATIAQGWYFAKAMPIEQFGVGVPLSLP
ncbi:MAG TPA: GGDEF domain-containing protein [Marinobacter sp.]|uniref:GGDEF domain-containing protein n=2 Tax=root TaxID=1 RepID=A0A831VXY2_9GAMM|nr:GGDEF domain-containing protein [Marinobacter sp.]HEA52291.1 GGDEF domain-containing protein [Marinobacter antarcticus]